jgi:hypothetical protein
MRETRRNPFRVEISRHQERRRSDFLLRSKQARADAIQQARKLAIQIDADTDAEKDSDMEVCLRSQVTDLSTCEVCRVTQACRVNFHSLLVSFAVSYKLLPKGV